MKMLDLINEAESDADKNRRHQKDLDDLERDIRKSGGMDKDMEAAFNAKRRELAAQRSKMRETTSAGSIASVATPVGGLVARQPKNSDGTAKNAVDGNNLFGTKKKKTKSNKA